MRWRHGYAIEKHKLPSSEAYTKKTPSFNSNVCCNTFSKLRGARKVGKGKGHTFVAGGISALKGSYGGASEGGASAFQGCFGVYRYLQK